jgi:hypothetical protein
VSLLDRVHVFLPGGAGSFGLHVALGGVIALVETHNSSGTLLDGLVNVGEPLVGGGLGRTMHHRHKICPDIAGLGLPPIVSETELAAESSAEVSFVVGETALFTSVAVASGSSGGRSRGRDS